MPDIMLLPRIANELDVTLDDLFAEHLIQTSVQESKVFNEKAVHDFPKNAQAVIIDSLCQKTNLTVLSPSSNLAAFIRDYRILQTGQFEGYGELWRLFDCLCTDDTTNLPKDSSLRRAYAERIDRAEPIFWGQGFFLYLDGKILTS